MGRNGQVLCITSRRNPPTGNASCSAVARLASGMRHGGVGPGLAGVNGLNASPVAEVRIRNLRLYRRREVHVADSVRPIDR
jgi:hypothetical protein